MMHSKIRGISQVNVCVCIIIETRPQLVVLQDDDCQIVMQQHAYRIKILRLASVSNGESELLSMKSVLAGSLPVQVSVSCYG